MPPKRSATTPSPPPTPDRREAILAAAESVFAEKGFAATTMESIAKRAGVAKGSLYNYFESKHDVFSQLFVVAMGRYQNEAQAIAAQGRSPSARIERMVDSWAERLESYRLISQLVLEFWAAAARERRKGLFGELCHKHYAAIQGIFADIVREGVESGEFASHVKPDEAASLVLALLRGITVHSILGFGDPVTPELLESIKRSIAASLKTPLDE